MSTFNLFRPSLDVLEGRAVLSAVVPRLDFAAAPTGTAQTREHILLARQVGVPVTQDAFRLVSGEVPAAEHKEAIEISSWSWGASKAGAADLYRFYGDLDGGKG